MRAETTTSFSIAEPHSMEDSPFSQVNTIQTELTFTLKNRRQRYEIQNKCSVGRGSEVDLQVDDATLSRRHFEISKVGDNFVLKDLGSTNGTYVNGHSIKKSVLLKSGDTVSSGAIQFKFTQSKTRRLHLFDRSSQPSNVTPSSRQNSLKKWAQIFFWVLLFLVAGLTILVSLFPRQKTTSPKSSSITPGQLQAAVLTHEASQAVAMGDFQRALTSLEGASRKNGDQTTPFQKSVKEMVAMRHDLERENETWEQVQEKQIRTGFHLERAYQQMTDRDLTAALNSFQEVLFIDPGNAKANDGIYQLRLLQKAHNSLSSQKALPKISNAKASYEEIQRVLEFSAGGDLKSAYQDYLSLKKEYPHDRRLQEIEKKLIDAMEQTAVKAFAEAAIFQNIPDFEAARKRWQLVLELLPATHPYFKKAQEKLSRSYL